MFAMILKGALVSGALIVAIGAQNAFVLKQGLLKRHVFWVAAICFGCDFMLIGAGVLGLGSLLGQNALLSGLLSLAGGLFLLWYGFNSLRSAFSSKRHSLVADGEAVSGSLKKTVAATFAVTLLNPHVYVDTVMLVGGVAAPLAQQEKIWFLLGAVGVSFCWFFGLAYGARLLKPLFANPRAWKVLETLIGIGMWYLAFGLLRHVWASLHGL